MGHLNKNNEYSFLSKRTNSHYKITLTRRETFNGYIQIGNSKHTFNV